MTESRMDDVKDSRKLKGKTNFISWKREFERAARAHDILEYLTGEESVPPKPDKENYFVKPVETEVRRSSRSKKMSQAFTPSTDDDEVEEIQIATSTNNTLRWQIDHNEYKTAKEKMKLAGRLLNAWVSDGINIEVEDCIDAREAYDLIKKRYAVANERARDDLLNRLHDLKLDDHATMTEYTNKLRQIKADLKMVKYDMTDDMLVTALLHGLPSSYQDFKEKYDWIRSTKPDDPPDLDYLYERLHVEDAKQIRRKEEKKARDKSRMDSSSSRTSGDNGFANNRRLKREDKSHLQCTHPSCRKTGHTEDTCWTKDPSKAPRAIKEKFASGFSDKPASRMGGASQTNLDAFREAYSEANTLGPAYYPSPHANKADTSAQMRSAEVCKELQGSGGAGTSSLEPELSKRTLGAFLAGTSCTSDTWLADTGANMHIVNDIKWFERGTFRQFANCPVDISTADGSATLEIKGGGKVRVILKNIDGVPATVTLSEVAYAPQGRCNLFSCGMFAQKAILTGIYNDKHMTWVDSQGRNIGYATFDNGLYHLNAEQAASPFQTREVIAATVDFDDPVWQWHRRLGHLGLQNMLKLLDSSTGMSLTATQIRAKLKAICPVCAVTRALVKVPRDPAKRHAQEPGQTVHVDVWGPYPIEGFDGTRYFLFITDDCTRYTWSARFDRKHQLLDVFKALVRTIQKTYNIVIRCCRLDNEFENGPVGRWCDAQSISREPIEPYAHYQNGVAERVNRVIREKAAPMMQETTVSGQVSKILTEKGTELLRVSSIPENLWPEAIQHAVWLKNRAPARALRKKDAKTPYEALKGDKPTLSRERVWGSRAYVTYPTEFRLKAEMTKLHSPRGWLGYFVGCESEAMYHIYSPEKHKVYRVGTARIEDGKGLDDSHDAPCLEDRVSTTSARVFDQDKSKNADQAISGQNRDGDGTNLSPHEAESLSDSYISGADDDTRPSDTGPESDHESSESAVVSRYFNKSGHAGMAKRKKGDDLMLGPMQNRQATHVLENVKESHTSSGDSDADDDSWYYSDDGSVSHTYWDYVAKHGTIKMKNYRTDDEKCDRCFRFGRRCNLSRMGMPCTMCTQRRERCRTQTAQTKKLVLPENRTQKKQIVGSEQNPPCRKCFIFGLPCFLADPVRRHCDRCKRLDQDCVWNLEGAKQRQYNEIRKAARKEAARERRGFDAVAREKKCYRCENKRIACDGKYPCNRCNTTRLRATCRPQGLEELPICNMCSVVNARCDRGRPCKRCVSKKTTCSYKAQDGLLFRSYVVPGGPIPKGFASVGVLEEGDSSDEECVRCRRRKLNCSGGQPCHRCVSDQITFQIAQCNYRHSDGTYDSWMVRPFQIDELGQPIIREGYERYTGRKRNTTEEIKGMIGRSRGGQSASKEDPKSQSEDMTDIDNEIDNCSQNELQEPAKDRLKRFKFALSAYSSRDVPQLMLVPDKSKDARYWESKQAELRSHEEKGTWRVVPLPTGIRPVTSRWVNTDKYGPDGHLLKHKSRLVARGFQQEEGVDYDETFASVVKPASTRILLALAAILHWRIHQGDIKTAFLNSDLERPVYMRPPKDIKLPHGFCLMVVRALYGLKQSPRAWYQKLRQTLIGWGWRVSAYDPCVFINDGNGLFLEVHVDDINVMGKDLKAILDVKTQISDAFPMTDEGECSWYLGMHVEQKPGQIRIHQKKYIDQIVAKYGFSGAAPTRTPLGKVIKVSTPDGYTAPPNFRKEYQSKVGSLNFAGNQTRPDIAFATGYVARYASNPSKKHMDVVDQIFTYLKYDPGKGITYSDKQGVQLSGFVDSDFAGCEDSRRSTTGWVFTLAGGPVSWSSQRQKTVATSTMDAEYIAGAEAAKEAVWIRNFINDLRIPGVHIENVPLYIDNNSALKLTRNPEFHSRSKHIDVKHHFIREKVDEGVIDTQRVGTSDNLADILTKALPKTSHEDLVTRLNLLSG